jgi:large subunit ribosomal protein L18
MTTKPNKKIKKRAFAKIFGTKEQPRLSVFRSNKHIYAQLIDDEKGETLVSASDLELKTEIIKGKLKRQEIAKKVGETLAQKAIKKKIKKVVFDRGSYKFHGRIKALVDGAREKGLQF